ncbi:PPPDE putative peptidase domain-containing protein [Daedaleopsis nitida]|nr:PPPDE putative peptidase domain-containing protein [Daedaleopsis nitida]
MSKVQLYVYDLSNGLARQLSRQLTGRQIDGIWHTSVVVFGKEVFYGQGILITKPGQSHHGTPLQVIDMGETALDEETFDEYLAEIREHYTADKYHLLEFNCNSFTNDCIGFLTGGSIPAWIKDLPSDFLSTPFGAALRPTIDAMFRRPVPGAAPVPPAVPAPEALQQAASASPDPALASALLQAVASQAYQTGSLSMPTSLPQRPPAPGSSTVAGPIHMCTNAPALHGLLQSHRAAVVFFTSATCGPCRMIEPVFEDLAHQKTHGRDGGRAAFVKVDMAMAMGGQVGAEWGVRVTPTFLFFLDGKKTHELKGVNAPELRTQVDLLLYQAFPPHPHAKLSVPSVEALSTNPILFTQVPALDTVSTKLTSFVDAASNAATLQTAKQALSSAVLPYLKSRFPDKNASAVATKKPTVPATPQLLTTWAAATTNLVNALPPAQLFPLVDMWRLAVLDEPVANWLVSSAAKPDPLDALLQRAFGVLDSSDPAQKAGGRNYLLTVLRTLANGFAHAALCKTLLSRASPRGKRAELTRVVVATLLHEDATVRTAAASLAFNVAATVQRSRVEKLRGVTAGAGLLGEIEEDEEWEVELVCVVLETLSNEVTSEEVVHRLVAALAFLLRLSPSYEGQLASMLEVLQSRETLKSKLAKGGCGESGVQKAEVRKLIEEVAEKLCPA